MRHLMSLLVAAASVLSTGPAYADLGDQLFKLLPDDGAAIDNFGISVAISGATAIVGAPLDDDTGFASGSAYLFDATTGLQIVKLLPDDGAAVDLFGYSVAISGATAIVGTFESGGSAYLFDTTTGVQIAKLLPNDGAGGDAFGISVAISPDGVGAIVGAYLDDDNGTFSGSAYLFDISDPANPTQIAKLLANDGAAFDNFGNSVAISGTTAIVGAIRDDDNGNASGSAYLFDSTTGWQIAKLLPNDGAAEDCFGHAVAISGATAIVGAIRDDDNGNASGSAYLFDSTTGWQIAKLLPDDGAEGDRFGNSVAISGATAIVGALNDDDNGLQSGSAYLFDISDPAKPVQIAKLLADDGAANDRFGISVGISGATAIVGAYRDDDNDTDSGSAYLFDTITGRQIAKLLANDGAAEDWFGRSVAISGATAIVGAYQDDDNGLSSGSAYLFDAVGASACPWDLDCDGVVGVGDLLILVHNFGPCDGECPADFDEDGFVGASDLVALIANLGECPGTGCPWDVNGDGVVDRLDVLAVNDNRGPCKDPDNCPWDVNGDGVVDGADVSEVATHFGPCPKE